MQVRFAVGLRCAVGAALAAMLCACAGGPADPTAGRGEEVPDISELCGTRVTSTVPAPGRLRAISTTVLEFDPPDSGLAKVISVVQDLDGCEEDASETVELEIGEGGAIVSIDGDPALQGQRFAIADGCLEIAADPPADNTNDNADGGSDSGDGDSGASGDGSGVAGDGSDSGDGTSGSSDDPGPCGVDGFPIFQEILNADPETDPYICVQVTEGDSCQDCSEEAGAWLFTTRSIVTFRALRSLAGVQAVDLCEGSAELVDIRLGQTVRMTVTTTTRFEAVIE
ncbi:MAG: hypothetical protein IT449_02565 [Phycisphaerales bacterium]|nr:hypothetical protein [Phycisphaerales bacterium]